MRTALRLLARDARVVGIAAAIAIGYTLATFVGAAARIVLDVAADEGDGISGPYVVAIAGRSIAYEALVAHGVALVVVVLVAALALRSGEGEPA